MKWRSALDFGHCTLFATHAARASDLAVTLIGEGQLPVFAPIWAKNYAGIAYTRTAR